MVWRSLDKPTYYSHKQWYTGRNATGIIFFQNLPKAGFVLFGNELRILASLENRQNLKKKTTNFRLLYYNLKSDITSIMEPVCIIAWDFAVMKENNRWSS